MIIPGLTAALTAVIALATMTLFILTRGSHEDDPR